MRAVVSISKHGTCVTFWRSRGKAFAGFDQVPGTGEAPERGDESL